MDLGLVSLFDEAEMASLADNWSLPEGVEPLTRKERLRWEREALRRRIDVRLRERLAQGMIEELERLHRQGVPWETLEFYGLEYRFIARHLKGELNRNDMLQKLGSAIHDFAKRQDEGKNAILVVFQVGLEISGLDAAEGERRAIGEAEGVDEG